MIQMYKKNKRNEKFYGCEKLYFTELLYERKRKAREKENFTVAPARSCFVTVVSCICCYFCWGRLDVEGPGNRFRVCATPPPPSVPRTRRHPPSEWPSPTRLLLHRATSKGGSGGELWGRGVLLLLLLRPLCFCDDGVKKGRNAHEAEYIKAVSLFPLFFFFFSSSHLVPKGAFSQLDIRASPASVAGFAGLLA